MASKTKQRGSGWSIKLVFNLYKLFGYKFIYYLMYPVTFFYFIFATNVKEALVIYYKNLDIEFTNKIYYEHLRIFAICMVDRFISKAAPNDYKFKFKDNDDAPINALNKGAIVLYVHFGGWAVSQNALPINNKLHIVAQEAMLDSIKDIENSLDQKKHINIINLDSGAISVSIQIANALLNDEVVALMADRAVNEKAEIKIDFLGKTANFNKNPFQIAYKMNKPIMVYFIALTNMQEYKVEHIEINMNITNNEDEAIKEALQTYITELERIVKLYPNQWFNFYNFWEKK